MPAKTILIMDRDLGFVFWLGQLLDDAGYQTLPARSSADAIALQDQFHLKIDLLILNPSLAGIREFTETVRSQEHMRIMAVIDEQEEPNAALMADVLRRKPSVRDNTSKIEWLAAIEQAFTTEKARPVSQCRPKKGANPPGDVAWYSFPRPAYFQRVAVIVEKSRVVLHRRRNPPNAR